MTEIFKVKTGKDFSFTNRKKRNYIGYLPGGRAFLTVLLFYLNSVYFIFLVDIYQPYFCEGYYFLDDFNCKHYVNVE